MSHLTFLNDPIALRDRGEYWIECYLLNPSGVETVVRFSLRGYGTRSTSITIGSDTIVAHTPFRKRIIKIPSLTQSLWKPGNILGSSFPSFGSFALNNIDGALDVYHPDNGWTWLNRRCKVFFLDYADVSGTIGKVFDGNMGDAKYDLGNGKSLNVEVPLLGRESLFDVPLSNRVFRGTAYALELFGDRTVNFGTPAAVNLTGNMTIEGWVWLEALPTAEQQFWGWIGTTGNRPWRLQIGTDGRLRIRCTIGGVAEGPYSTKALSVKQFYHVAVVISGRTLTYYIWDDDNQVLTTEVLTNTFSSATRDGYSGTTVYQVLSGNDATFRPWCDEFRVWNTAKTLIEIEANRFRPLVSGSIPASCVHCVPFDDGTGTTVTDLSATAANGTISGAGTSTWLWMHEGPAELSGTPKPDVYGEKSNVLPVLVDSVRQGYCVAGGGPINDVTSYEGGLSHTASSSANFRSYITTTPAAGQMLRYLAKGLFKLGSSPTLPISALVKGYSGGLLGYVNQMGTVSRDIITRRGPKLVDPTDLDTASFTAFNALSTSTPIIGAFIRDPKSVTIHKTLDNIFRSGAAWWGYKRSETKFHIERFNGPSVTPDFELTQKHIISITPLSGNVVIHEVVVKYRQNHVIHTEDQISATVKTTTTNWQRLMEPWQEQPSTDETLRTSTSVSVTFETLLEYQQDAKNLADFLLSILKGPKKGYNVHLTRLGLSAVVGQTCSILIVLPPNSSNRLALDGTTMFSINTVRDQTIGEINFETWGDRN